MVKVSGVYFNNLMILSIILCTSWRSTIIYQCRNVDTNLQINESEAMIINKLLNDSIRLIS